MAEHSTPALVEIPASANLTDVVFERAQRAPGTVVMRRQAEGAAAWRDVTAGEFRDEATALAKGLIAAGIEAGDRVALMSRTRYEWTLADYAIWAAGAVTVPIYETSSAEQVEWMLGDSGARALILETPDHEEATAEVIGRLPAVERGWLIEGTPAASTAQPLDALPAEGTAVTDAQLQQHRAARSASNLATVIYTSGTTGRPKGCELTHGNLLADVRNVVSAIPEIFDTVTARRCCSCHSPIPTPASSRSAAWSRAPCSATRPTWPGCWTTCARSLRPSSSRYHGFSRRCTTAPSCRPPPARSRARALEIAIRGSAAAAAGAGGSVQVLAGSREPRARRRQGPR